MVSLVFLTLTAQSDNLPSVMWAEAEACEIVCAVEKKPGESLFASGGKFTPFYWGQTVGDKIAWKVKLSGALSRPYLAVRYAYGKQEFGKNPNSARKLHVVVDNKKPIEISVPDTGAWIHYDVAWAALPRLGYGEHTIVVQPFEEFTNTDVDCIGLFGTKPRTPDAPFVKTLAAISPDGRYHYRRSAWAKLPDQDRIFAQFNRIYSEMKSYSGWVPGLPVGINVIEDRLWPNQEATAFSNGAGCFFRESFMPNDYGNWAHEMNHLMFNGHCAPWLEESLVRVMTSLIWVSRIFADAKEKAIHYDAMAACGKEFRKNPDKQFDSLEFILRVLADRYGPDIFGKFLRACTEASAKSELSLAPYRKMNTQEVMKYMSAAAGEDVTPIFKRWTGFAGV